MATRNKTFEKLGESQQEVLKCIDPLYDSTSSPEWNSASGWVWDTNAGTAKLLRSLTKYDQIQWIPSYDKDGNQIGSHVGQVIETSSDSFEFKIVASFDRNNRKISSNVNANNVIDNIKIIEKINSLESEDIPLPPEPEEFDEPKKVAPQQVSKPKVAATQTFSVGPKVVEPQKVSPAKPVNPVAPKSPKRVRITDEPVIEYDVEIASRTGNSSKSGFKTYHEALSALVEIASTATDFKPVAKDIWHANRMGQTDILSIVRYAVTS